MPAHPENINFLSNLGFKFSVRKLPNVSWFVQTVSVPGMSLPEAEHPTPFQMTYRPGRTVEFNPLMVTFKVDEEINAFIELTNWMRGIGFPESYSEYKKNTQGQNAQGDAVVSDATLMILNSNMNATHEITFLDLFPIEVAPLEFASTSGDIEHLTVSASFRYLRYDIRKISQ
tara:strand:- start:310 stop:828 length:519 start_codon:yes stop_codon:yes gene_type:complete